MLKLVITVFLVAFSPAQAFSEKNGTKPIFGYPEIFRNIENILQKEGFRHKLSYRDKSDFVSRYEKEIGDFIIKAEVRHDAFSRFVEAHLGFPGNMHRFEQMRILGKIHGKFAEWETKKKGISQSSEEFPYLWGIISLGLSKGRFQKIFCGPYAITTFAPHEWRQEVSIRQAQDFKLIFF